MEKTRSGRSRIIACVATGCVAALLAAGRAAAVNWEFTPYIDGEIIYTDNILLAPPGEEESETVLRAAPGFKLKGKGPRLDLDLQYELSSYLYLQESDRNETFQQFEGSALATLIQDNLYFDVTGGVGQSVIDPTGRVPLSNLTESANRTNSTTWTAHPYYEHNFAHDFDVHAGYQYGQVKYTEHQFEGRPIEDLAYESADVSFGQEPEASRFGWAAYFIHYLADYEIAEDYAYDMAGVRTKFELVPSFALTARGGRESDVTVDRSAAGLDATFWAAGFIWKPSKHHELSASAGERFFGNSYSGKYLFTGRRLKLGLEYSEDPTTQGIDLFNRPIFGGDPDQVGPGFTPISTELYINKYWRGWGVLKGVRNTIELQAYDDQRTYVESPGDERERGANVHWTHLFGPRTQVYLGVNRSVYEYRSSTRMDYFTHVQVGGSRQLGRHMSVYASLQYYHRSSNDDAPELQFLLYTENAATIGMRYQF